jgi:polyisoprenoid-binding protein YceI
VKLFVSVLSLFFFLISHQAFAEDSSVEVTVRLSPVGSYIARTSQVQGLVKVNGDKVIASNVIVQAKTLKTGITLRDKHTQDRLKVDQFPEIMLVSGEGASGKGKGIIKLMGIEKSIEGTYKIEGKKMMAQFKLSIKQFGIENVKYLGVGVKEEVEIKVQLPIASN